jgi:uncharacterized protein
MVYLKKHIYINEIQPFINSDVEKEAESSDLKMLLEKELIIDEDTNEQFVYNLINKRFQSIFSTNNFKLTIIPTLECNFNCWYCYESHPVSKMSKAVYSNIESLVRNITQTEGITKFQLDWFGGEPLLYYNDIVHPLTLFAKEICNNSKINYQSSITTNGYLITENMAKSMNSIGLNSFQITIDGDKDLHDKIRRDKKNGDTFKTIIKNLHILNKYIDGLNVILRVNYTNKTLLKIENIIPHFNSDLKEKIVISFQRVWQSSDREVESSELFEEIEQKFIEHNLKVEKKRLSFGELTRCYADVFSQAVINYDGNVFKCTARDFTNSSLIDGKLNFGGIINWNNPKLFRRLTGIPFTNNQCKECKFLPICLGTCSQKYIENEFFYNNECHIKLLEETVTNELLSRFYDHVTKITN